MELFLEPVKRVIQRSLQPEETIAERDVAGDQNGKIHN